MVWICGPENSKYTDKNTNLQKYVKWTPLCLIGPVCCPWKRIKQNFRVDIAYAWWRLIYRVLQIDKTPMLEYCVPNCRCSTKNGKFYICTPRELKNASRNVQIFKSMVGEHCYIIQVRYFGTFTQSGWRVQFYVLNWISHSRLWW